MNDTTVKVRGATYEKLQRIADENRWKIVEVIDALADGWRLLSAEQQLMAIRRQTHEPNGAAATEARAPG